MRSRRSAQKTFASIFCHRSPGERRSAHGSKLTHHVRKKKNGTRPKIMSGFEKEKVLRSRKVRASRAGPRVIRRKINDGGYFVVFRKESTVKSAVGWCDKFVSGPLGKFHCCFYGQITYQVRISRYTNWIDSVISGK
jgi:hypothetical protein